MACFCSLASGLSVTLGLMNFINLAHGAFAIFGGYMTALLMNCAGAPFLATLPAAFVIPALLGVVLERTLYRRLQRKPLDQVLFTIGLVLMAMPIAPAYLIGDEPQQVHLPTWLSGRIDNRWRRDRRHLPAVHHCGMRRHLLAPQMFLINTVSVGGWCVDDRALLRFLALCIIGSSRCGRKA